MVPRVARPQTAFRNLFLRATLGRPRPAGPLPVLSEARRVLLVYVNWRLGNTILITPAVEAFRRAMPKAEIDLVGGGAAAAILQGFDLGRIRTLNRHVVFNPVRLSMFLGRLRREAYDTAIHVHSSTATIGAYVTARSGATHRLGGERPSGNLCFTATVPLPTARHKTERMKQYVEAFGVPCSLHRRMRLTPAECAEAAESLLSVGSRPRVAVFLSGRSRKGKAFDLPYTDRLLRGMRAAGMRPYLLLGPEEARRTRRILRALGDPPWIAGLGLREVAAWLAASDAVVVPDSGPMHLAIAAGAPTLALFRRPDSEDWGPLPGEGAIHRDPEARDPEGAVLRLGRLLEDRAARRGDTLKP